MSVLNLIRAASNSDVLTTSIDRRNLIRKAAGAGAVAAVAGLGLARSAGATDPGHYFRTTSRVNMRTGSSTSKPVVQVIPSGALLYSLSKSKNGFEAAVYLETGARGWVHSDYLEDAVSNEYPDATGTAQTTDRVNFRSQPSSSASVIRVLDAGTTVYVYDQWKNGYRKVGYAMSSGWIHTDYLSSDSGGSGGPLGGYVVTTSSLNLRAEPSTTAKVLLVMPKGAKAFRGDVIASGFINVTYNGVNGWAHKDYLQSV